MRKLYVEFFFALILSALSIAGTSARAEDFEDQEEARNYLYEHNVLFVRYEGDRPTKIFTEEFTQHFPPHICKPSAKWQLQTHKPTTLTLVCPAFWGSGQQLTFDFVEVPYKYKYAAGSDLYLKSVRLNGKELSPAEFRNFVINPYTTYATFQKLLESDVTVSLYDDGRPIADLGSLKAAYEKNLHDGFYCHIITLDPATRQINVDCPLGLDDKALSNPKTFQYTFQLLGHKQLALIAGRTGADHKLVGSEFIAHAQERFAH
jgi:hypothetical protein